MRYLFAVNLIIVLLIILNGCSSGRISLVLSDQGTIPESVVGVSDWDGSTPTGGMGTLGFFNLKVDPDKVEADISPVRASALKDVLEIVDITNFLTMAPCINCVKVKSVALDPDGNLVVSIGIRHPFAKGDPFKPITGRNRADLNVFNIEGIVISNAPSTSFPGAGQSVAGFRLKNADGYTGYLDSAIDEFYPTDATIHPYITHFDDYSVGNFDPLSETGFTDVLNPSGNLVMAMGCDFNLQDYVFAIDQPFDFVYAVGCTYALSAATKSKRFTPEYRIPQHNKKAASEIAITIVTNDLRAGVTTSAAAIEIRVVDINHGVMVGDGLDQMRAESSVSRITVDVPGVMSAPCVIDGTASISGTGHSPSDALVYPGKITNTMGAAEGRYPGLVKASDNYAPGQNEAPILNGMDGIKRVDPMVPPTNGVFAITEFATYQAFEISVAESCDPPIPTAINPSSFSTTGTYNDVIIDGQFFTGSGGVTDVYLDDGTHQIHASGITVLNDTQLTCDFQFNNDPAGDYDVVVFTACEGRGVDLARLNSEVPEWSCFQYNSTNIGQNLVAQTFDPTTCTQKWFKSNTGLKYSGPAITENYAYVSTNDSFYSNSTAHRLTCYEINNSGNIKWEKLINPTGEYARAHTSPCWFDDGSDGRVVIGGDRVWCLDAVTGSVEWEYGLSYTFIGSSPRYWNGRIYIAGSGMIHSVDAMTGLDDKRSVTGLVWNESTCAVTDGRVYVGNGNDPNGIFTCLDASDLSIIWQTTGLSTTSHWDAPLVIDGRVYYASYQQKLTCLDAETGAKIWQYTEASSDAWITACTTWVDPSDGKRVIYFGGAFAGGCHAVKDMGSTASLLWKSPAFYCDASPIYNDGIIYIGAVDSGNLFGYDCKTGSQVFVKPLGDVIRGAAGFAFNRMIVLGTNGVYCFE